MFGLGFLDTVIGVVFVFLLVSMLVTIGNELIAAILMSRAKWLNIGIKHLLGPDWAKRLYAHPLIGAKSNPTKGPSYIPSRSFANVIMDLIRNSSIAIGTPATALQTALYAAFTTGATVEDLRTALTAADARIGSSSQAAADAATKVAEAAKNLPSEPDEATTMVQTLIDGFTKTDVSTTDDTLPTVTDAGVIGAMEALQAATNPTPDTPRLPDSSPSTPATVDDLKKALSDTAAVLQASADAAKHAQEDLALLRAALPQDLGKAIQQVQQLIGAFHVDDLRKAIASVPDEYVKSQLQALFKDAENDIETFKQNIEIWFNNAMDRVGGWYKRKTQWVAFFLALAVTIGMNVDTLAVIRYLQAHPTESAALVAEAQSFVKENPTAVQRAQGAEEQASSDPDHQTYTGVLKFDNTATNDGDVKLKSDQAAVALSQLSIPVKKGAEDVKFTVTVPISTTAIKATITASGMAQGMQTLVLPAALPAQYRAVHAELDKLGLPIGWVRSKPNDVEIKQRQETPFVANWPFVNLPLFGDTVLYHALGWFITALAATLGAPFWFDTLNRLISIRSAGKAPEENPKPPKEVPEPREPGKQRVKK